MSKPTREEAIKILDEYIKVLNGTTHCVEWIQDGLREGHINVEAVLMLVGPEAFKGANIVVKHESTKETVN